MALAETKAGFQWFERERVLSTAEGVALGFVGVAALTWVVQHLLQIQSSQVRGRLVSWCPGAGTAAPTLTPVSNAIVVVAGTAGPGAGGVFQAQCDAVGRYQLALPPGLYLLAVALPDGRQVPPMVLTAKTASGELQLTQALELVYDVWAQMIVPASGAITVDLVVNC